MVRQGLNEMSGTPKGKFCMGEEKPENYTQRQKERRTHTNPRTQRRGQAINRKVKMALLNTFDEINLVITTAEHRARSPHLLERSLRSC